jgi:NitT/TauT family transport system permease protein
MAPPGLNTLRTNSRSNGQSDFEEIERLLILESKSMARRERVSRIASPILVLISLLAAWEAIVRLFDLPPYLIPAPTLVGATLVDRWDLLWTNTLGTLSAISIGFLLAVSIGTLLAILTYSWKPFQRGVYPLISAAQAVPKVAIAPLLAIWFGFTLTTRSLMAFLLAVFPVLISTLVGLRSIAAGKILLSRSIGLSRLQTFTKVRLPQALPSMFGGAKVAFTLASVGAIIGEFLGGGQGLGYLIVRANHDFATPLMFATLTVLAAYALLIFAILEAIEKWLLPWNQPVDTLPTHGS